MTLLSWLSSGFALALIGSLFVEIGSGGLAPTIGLGLLGTIALGRVRNSRHRARQWASDRQPPQIGDADRAESREGKLQRRNLSLANDGLLAVADPPGRIASELKEDECDARRAA